MMLKAKPLDTLSRGVWVAPWVGPNDEMVLLAITSDGKLATANPVVIPNGASRIDVSDQLWQLLDEMDVDLRANLRVI
jgi:hypothetical protein